MCGRGDLRDGWKRGRSRCPGPHAGLWSLPRVSQLQHVALIGVKSECYHPPQPGAHKIRQRSSRCRCCCPRSAGAMGYVSFVRRIRALLSIQNQLARECLAELLAVFVLIVSGVGGCAGGGPGWREHRAEVPQPCSCAVPTGGCLGVGGGCAGTAVTPNLLTSGLDPRCDSPQPNSPFAAAAAVASL